MNNETRHICVCICTYKRPQLLERLLRELSQQETGGKFTLSVVVADNDRARSAESVVAAFAASSAVPALYCVQPVQSVPLTRNKSLENADGDLIAFIDDDEFPTKRWLLTLLECLIKYDVGGVLGPVESYFDEETPKWVVKGNFYGRAKHPTGYVIPWTTGRTGNVLFKKSLLVPGEEPFRSQFQGGGADQDFFRRLIENGHVFVWCEEAVAYEVIPPIRWKRSFMMKRALLRGRAATFHPDFGAVEIAKSLVAVPIYALGLPFAWLLGQHRFMALLISLCDHLGKLLALFGIRPIKQAYVTE